MSDFISRQAAIDALRKMQTYKMYAGDDMLLIDQAGAMTELMLLPPAQPKRGRWIPVDAFTAFGGDEATWMANGNPTAFHYCSVCKGQAYAGEDGESLLTDFCPNCGADMRGDKDDQR